MGRTLISFIGRGRTPAAGEKTAARSGYAEASYDFGNGEIRTSSLFGWTLLKHLHAQEKKVHTWVLLGTSESLWAAVGDMLEDTAYEQAVSWLEKIESCPGGVIDQAILDLAPQQLATSLGVDDLTLRVVPDGWDTAGQRAFMKALFDSVRDGGKVVLDITHAFRHMPVMAAFGITALKWFKGVFVEGIFYGAYEMRKDRNSPSPVIDLSLCAEYSENAATMASHIITGDYQALSPLFPAMSEPLGTAGFLENIIRLDEARPHARKCLNAIEGVAVDDPLEVESSVRLKAALQWSTSGSVPERTLEKSVFFMKRKEYFKSVVLCWEALNREIWNKHVKKNDDEEYGEKSGKRIRDFIKASLKAENAPELRIGGRRAEMHPDLITYRELNDIRNAIVHLERCHLKSTRKAISDPVKFDLLLRKGQELARRVIAGELDLKPRVCVEK